MILLNVIRALFYMLAVLAWSAGQPLVDDTGAFLLGVVLIALAMTVSDLTENVLIQLFDSES